VFPLQLFDLISDLQSAFLHGRKIFVMEGASGLLSVDLPI
jgi:hypothetical protein